MNSVVATPHIAHHLQNLNPQQLEAVRHGAGPLLVFAGAGSGKTRVLTHRIVHLVLEHGASPERILAVTFTNKAAGEMKRRVYQIFQHSSAERYSPLRRHNSVSDDQSWAGQETTSADSNGESRLALPAPSWVSTFHAFCARLLRKHAKLLDFTQNFAIYDSDDTLSALKRVYTRLQIDPKFLDPKMVRTRIDRAKNQYHFSDTIRADRYIPEDFRAMIADIFDAYQAELLRSNAMDFGDLICNVVTLFKLEPKLLAHYQDYFSHLLIDEYQDTNRVQYLLVKMLAEKHRNLCVVGDDDQSIYAFRGATIENILNFRKDFPEAKVVTLELNYRSTKTILGAANAVISKNAKRQKKQMRTPNASGKPIICFRGFDERSEAEFVCREISTLRTEGVSASQIAIFYRTNAQSRAIEESLAMASIPYEIYGGHRFYDRKEIKDILAYVRLVVNENDNEAFLRVINTPTRGLGVTAVGNLVAYADRAKLSLTQALRNALTGESPTIPAANRVKFGKFLQLIDKLKESAEKTNELLSNTDPNIMLTARINALPNFLKLIADESEYLRRLKAEDSPEAESRIENIYELFGVAAEFVRKFTDEHTPCAIEQFLERASLASDLDKAVLDKADGDKKEGNNAITSAAADNKGKSRQKPTETVSLMTLHLAKGLEFDIVFLVGLEEGLLPHIRSMDDNHALEEERRLCYVGITRARKRLYLSRATTRQSFGRSNWYSGVGSRFIHDLPRDLVEDRQTGFLDTQY